MDSSQMSIFDGNQRYHMRTPIRLIELFAGYGSQSLALQYLGITFESYRICEWAVKSIQAYKDLHFPEDNTDYSKTMDVESVKEYLFIKGISSNYSEPMTEMQISRLSEEKARTIYNNIQATHNLVSICNAKAEDLGIVETEKYTYILSYSFPCQDLSLAGLGKGMEKGSGTRSGLLWEVERLLDSCKELPQVLVMENVPEVIGTKNIKSFSKWLEKLDSLGYHSKWKVLNSKDFGIPQNRNRCFMVSILGDYYYEFPAEKPLQLKLKDLLEENVDEKYYLSNSTIERIKRWNAQQDPLKDIDKEKVISPCLTARGAGEERSGMILINESLKQKLCNKLIQENKVQEGDIIRHSYTNNRLSNGDKNLMRTESKDHLSPTLDTRCDCLGIVVKEDSVFVPEKTKKGYSVAHDGDGIYINRPEQKRGCVQKQMIQTLKTSNNDVAVVVKDTPTYLSTYQYCKSEKFMYGKDRYQHNKIISDTLLTSPKEGIVYNNLRIRKLTPKECFRLMGVKDEDFEKVKKNQSDSSLYHLAGDSIVTSVLMAIFRKLI